MVFMLMRLSLLFVLCGILFSQSPEPPLSPAIQVKNYARGTLAFVSCEQRSPDTAWFLTVRNISNSPLGYITVSGYDGGSLGEDFLGATIVAGTVKDTFYIQSGDGLAPGESHTIRVTGSLGKPERVFLLSTVTMAGRIEGIWVEAAATFARWLGEFIQIQNISELTKPLMTDDSDHAIDAVIERINALDTQPPLTIDKRIQGLVADPSLSQRNGSVQFAFYVGLDKAKQDAVHQLTKMKELAGEARHNFAQAMPLLYAAKTDRLTSPLNELGKYY
jgi:hypothetical protein